MKNTLLLLLFLSSGSTWALYGNKVNFSNDSFVVSLINNGSFFCSGVLISKTTVITAGHCIEMQGQEIYDSGQALIYHPENLILKIGSQLVKAKKVTLSPVYFEGLGFNAEDIALIELSHSVKNVSPIKIASRSDLLPLSTLHLIARKKKVEAKLLSIKKYQTTHVLFLDKASGACLGDSGGAVTINKNGQQKLAGVLIYSGDEECEQKTGYSYLPKLQF